ncbi:hypothetical protein NFI96_000865 [Prochilodus magdalenae]|nr:hypothetical protein NFI96_000865 [Prochilodus magdalenae]
MRHAAMVCRELDCGSAVAATSRKMSEGDEEVGAWADCRGTESTLKECVDHYDAVLIWGAEVICLDSVRLMDGAERCSGRVEVKSHQSWTTVCEADFDRQDAEVVCRELGCGPPLTLQGALFGAGKLPFGTKEFQCRGTENHLLDCSTSDRGSACTRGSAVGLTCAGPDDVRLVDGSGRCAGAVEMYYSGGWRGVGAAEWSIKEAALVCGQLDCGSAVATRSTRDGTGTGVVIQCNGSESALRECRTHYVADKAEGAEVMCSDSVRLVDGTERCSGRVEVKPHQSWTTVCQGDFDRQDAEVVCRELGCGAPLTLQGTLYGKGELPFGTKEFQCNGTEDHLLTCSTSDRESTCTRGSAVELTCAEVRLVGEDSRCAGTVEIYRSGGWRRVKGYIWGLTEAAVVCRELGCDWPTQYGERRSDDGGQGLMIACTDFTSTLSHCSILDEALIWKTDALAICLGLLEKPTISISTPKKVSTSLKEPEVSRGHGFTITCSVQPQYPGGSFYLGLPRNGTSHTQIAVNHSASFFFSAADESHQGDYSCVYENQVTFEFEQSLVPMSYTGNFSSESEALRLTVSGPSLSAVVARMLVVPSVMLIVCSSIFLVFRKWSHILTGHLSGQQDSIELVSLQPTVKEEQDVERGA